MTGLGSLCSFATLVASIDDVGGRAETCSDTSLNVCIGRHHEPSHYIMNARLWTLRGHVEPEGRSEDRVGVSVNEIRILQKEHLAVVGALDEHL